MAILTRYLEHNLSDASHSLLLVNTNADNVSVSHFNAHVRHSLDEVQRADITPFVAEFGDIARALPDDECAPSASQIPAGCSLCFLLIDLSRPFPKLEGAESEPLSQLSPASIASEILRMMTRLAAANLAASPAGKPAATQPDNHKSSIMPIALIDRSVDAVVARVIGIILNQHGSSLYFAKMPSEALTQRPVNVYERWAPLSTVILAAGKSSRMGRAKQVEIVNGQPMVVKAVTTALNSGAQKVIVVTGAYSEAIVELLDNTGLTDHPSLQIIHNPDYALGQSTSVKTAIAYLQAVGPAENQWADWGATVVMPVDQPYLTPLLIRRLFRLWRRGVQIAAPSIAGTPRGAPALFDNSLWSHLSELSGDIGAKPLLKKFSEQLATIESPQHTLFDIDSPDDLPPNIV